MRDRWTDDRMDDLNSKVDAQRLETKAEFAAVRAEMRERFDKVDERFDGVNERIDEGLEKIEGRFQAMDARLLDTYRMMMGFCGLMLAALIGLLATQI